MNKQQPHPLGVGRWATAENREEEKVRTGNGRVGMQQLGTDGQQGRTPDSREAEQAFGAL